MSRLVKNLGGMFFSRAWSAVLLLALVPVYIRFLGVEAYGVVGAFVTLQAFISLLDLGFGPTLTREFARMSANPDKAQEMRDLLRSLEVIYLVSTVLIALVVWVLAPAFANHWLQLGKLSPQEVSHGLAMAGVALAVQWPKNLYSAGLEGLQRQLTLSWVIILTATLRALMVILALQFIGATLEVFFLAQGCANALQTAILAVALWHRVPRAGAKASFKLPLVRKVMRFATGMTGISITTVALTQLDKAILSKTLPLKEFGYYVVAGTLASGLYVVVGPVFAVVFPRFSELVSKGKSEATARFYDLSSQLLSVAVLPLTAVISLFSPEILRLWTGNPLIAANSHLLLSLLIIGNAMNGLMNVPYALQLAHGWTGLALYSNVVAIALCLPTTYFMSLHFGAAGGAAIWVLLTFAYVVVSLPLMHGRLLSGRLRRWYLIDVGGPAVAAFAIIALVRAAVPRTESAFAAVMVLIGAMVFGYVAATMAAPEVRQALFSRIYLANTAG
jgi:O-antigen/teichoic acid export membrane protein